MILKNGNVMNSDFSLVKCDVETEGKKIKKLGNNLIGDEIIDVDGCFVLPGFIDTHIHGAYGTRVSDEAFEAEAFSVFEATQGVTSVAITTTSSQFGKLLDYLERAADASMNVTGAKLAAIHAEGPFLSVKYKGAMNPENIITPEIKKLDQMIEKSKGLLKLITVAPEAENACELIKYAVSKGITVSMGHTNATYDEAMAAINAGATQATHTFNAMRALNHREPGVLGASLTNEGITCEMICDYVHLHPATVKLIYNTKGADKINMISDSGHAAGMQVSEFEVDGLMRYVKDGVIRLADGTIAGSAKTLLDGVKNLVSSGIAIEDVSKMASLNPAKSLKLDNVTGSIKEGKLADMVVLDKDLNVKYTIINGKCVYKSN